MFESISDYSKKITSFHMPGHKGGKLNLLEDLYALDVTEVEGLDDLHHPTGIIQQVNQRIKNIYNTGFSTMLVNGSTGGILSAVSGCISPGSSVLIARNCHKAVYNSVLLNQLDAHYVLPIYDATLGFFGRVEAEVIEKALIANNTKNSQPIKAVIITSPTYEGMVSDITQISKIAHANNALLIVDEAHGAHFAYSTLLPISAINLGADVVIQSAHKTLPCLTQSAFLHVSQEAMEEKRVNVLQIQKRLAIYQTSSPSYLLMCSMEKGIDYMDQHRTHYDHYIQNIKAYLESYESQYGTWLYNLEIEELEELEEKEVKEELEEKEKERSKACGNQNEINLDITRLTFVIRDTCMTGWELNHRLRHEEAIQVELAGLRHIVAISTLADTLDDLQRLGTAINKILQEGTNSDKKNSGNKTIEHEMFNLNNRLIQTIFCRSTAPVHSIYSGYYQEEKKVSVFKALGGISCDFIIPYPPGIPLLVPGEVFTEEIIEYIVYLLKNRMEVYGIIEEEVAIYFE